MKPGETAAPWASTVRVAAPLNLPMSAILPSFTPTSPRKAGIPDPSTMRPLRINRSYVIGIISPLATSTPTVVSATNVAHPGGRAYSGADDGRTAGLAGDRTGQHRGGGA